ncbi:MAG: alcohol dehydrogenase catalytic domain-containing protein [Candidatus Eisenbacteria bacterium]|nr:alcohol dehydrogenase catalytic domain-containing protein [Candidatus Eisenbacteria bacterium]
MRVRTRLGGICGSDLAVVSLAASPATSPFSSFPFVLGHENVGEVVEVGRDVRGFAPGDRVVANPLLACRARGIAPPCAACAAGAPQRCERFPDGALPAGMLIGTTRGLGGSWGERFVAPAAQLLPVPAGVADEAAVLAEPLACAVHAVRGSLPAAGERVLVLGAGSIGLLTLAALRALAPQAEVTTLARHRFQAEHAERLGAARVVMAAAGTRALAAAAGARLLAPVVGPPVALGGFDRSYVCVAGRRAMEEALRFTRAGGTVALLGNARSLDRVDWTPLWLKELALRGSVCYGGGHAGAARGDFEEAMRLVVEHGAALRPLVTHTFPLAEHRRALATARDRASAGSVKVAFRF